MCDAANVAIKATLCIGQDLNSLHLSFKNPNIQQQRMKHINLAFSMETLHMLDISDLMDPHRLTKGHGRLGYFLQFFEIHFFNNKKALTP